MTRTIALLTAVLLAVGGCVIVAYPKLAGKPNRRVVTEESAKFIRRGVTTRADVVLALGSPDLVSDGEQRFVYASSHRTVSIVGVVVAVIGVGGVAEQARHRRTTIEIRFADDATVSRLRVESEAVMMPTETIRTIP